MRTALMKQYGISDSAYTATRSLSKNLRVVAVLEEDGGTEPPPRGTVLGLGEARSDVSLSALRSLFLSVPLIGVLLNSLKMRRASRRVT